MLGEIWFDSLILLFIIEFGEGLVMFIEEDRVLEEIIHDILEDEVEEHEEMHSIVSSEDSARLVTQVLLKFLLIVS